MEFRNDEDGTTLITRLGDEFPPGWRKAGVICSVRLILTEDNCVYRSFFRDFQAPSVDDAVFFVKKGREIFLSYGFASLDPQMDGAFEVDWPLSRRGQNAPVARPSCDVKNLDDAGPRDFFDL